MQNRCAYSKHAGRHLSKDVIHMHEAKVVQSTTISSVPALLPALIAHATMSLPTSPLFLEVVQSADALDESDLSQWEEEPPYSYAEPDSMPQEERFTRNLIEVMLGCRIRLSNKAKAQQRKRFENGDHGLIFTQFVHNITEQMVRWLAIDDTVGNDVSGDCNDQMAAC